MLGAAAIVVFVVGAPLYVGGVEADLEARVLAAAVETDPAVNGVRFNGQDGTVFCLTPLDYPASLVATLEEVRGVRTITADRTCRVLKAPTVDPDLPVPATAATSTTIPSGATTTTTTAAPSTSSTTTSVAADPAADGDRIIEQLASDPMLTTMARIVEASGRIAGESGPLTLLAPVDSAFDGLGADTLAALLGDQDALMALVDHLILGDSVDERVTIDGDNIVIDAVARRVDLVEVGSSAIWLIDTVLTVGTPGVVPTLRIDLAADAVTVSGTLSDTGALDRFVAAASFAGLPVTTAITPDDTTVIEAGDVGPLERLIRGTVTLLDTATITVDADGVTVLGTHLDSADADAVSALAAVLDAEVSIVPRPPATDADIDRLEDVIAELVAAEPIAFESGSARIVLGSDAVLERVTAILERNVDLDVIVRGHTDSNGVPASNLALSADRASAVVAALVARGVDPARLTAQGIGSAEPIIIDGVEDAVRSRRVEFVLVRG